MARNNKQDYDWLNDPFDEKKNEQDRISSHMSGRARLAVTLCSILALGIFVYSLIMVCVVLVDYR